MERMPFTEIVCVRYVHFSACFNSKSHFMMKFGIADV